MKTESILLLVLMAVLLLLSACSSDDDLVIPVEKSYADPQEALEDFRQLILSSDNGWDAVLSPQPGKMYKLFVDLNTQGKVSLYADADTVTAKTPTLTNYRIEITQQVNPTLLFDAGSNLDKIPGAGQNTGVDKAYSFKYSKGDTLYLLGNEHGDALKLVKATRNDRDRYLASALKNSVKNISNYLSTVRYLYIQPAPGKIIQYMTNPLSRGLYVTYLNNGVKFSGSDFSYSLDGLLLKNKLNTPGYSAQELFWDNGKKLLYTFYNGVRMDLLASPIPAIPLHYLLGNEYPAGTALPSPYVSLYPGWSPAFQTLWLLDDDGLWKVKISLYYVVFDLHVDNNTMDLYVYYLNDGEDVLTRGRFPYQFTKTAEGIYTFKPLALDLSTTEGENARMIQQYIPNILGVINGNRFRIEFYDAFETLGGIIPQYISVDNDKLYFTGFFY